MRDSNRDQRYSSRGDKPDPLQSVEWCIVIDQPEVGPPMVVATEPNMHVIRLKPKPNTNLQATGSRIYMGADASKKDIVDDIILTDDASQDETVELSKELEIKTFVHTVNKGYGANQKTCYQAALNSGADIIIMLHPDYQYTPKLITPMASMMAEGIFDAVIGSRILGNKALMGGMPLYKSVSYTHLTLPTIYTV